jgi:hypothetical protein
MNTKADAVRKIEKKAFGKHAGYIHILLTNILHTPRPTE